MYIDRIYFVAMIKPQTPRDDLTETPYFSPLQQYVYKPEHRGYVSFDSRMVLANNNYACFMTVNTGDRLAHPIPDSLKVRVLGHGRSHRGSIYCPPKNDNWDFQHQ